jgi:hypothetical protein
MEDDTEGVRRALLPTMPAELRGAVERGERVWDTERMREAFEVVGFSAPFVLVRRRSDGVKGTLSFTHAPRYYFGWQEA